MMGIATVLLIRNMNSRLRRLPDRFPKSGPDGQPQSPDGSTDGAAGIQKSE
jgi:hypothetical protein